MHAQRNPQRQRFASGPADLDAALAALRALVRQGVEYPDAHCNVIARFRLKPDQADDIADRYLLPEAGQALQTPVGAVTAGADERNERRFGHAGVLRVNRAHMHRWQVSSDNVRMHEAIVNAPGPVLVLDSRPYVECLCEFGIFFTLSPL